MRIYQEKMWKHMRPHGILEFPAAVRNNLALNSKKLVKPLNNLQR